MEKGDAESAAPPAYAAPVVRHIIKDNKKTLCTIVATVLTCAVIMVGAVGLSVHFLRSDHTSTPHEVTKQTPQHFDVNVNVNGKMETDEIEVDPDKKQIIITQKSRSIVTMEDFNTGFVAAKDINNRTCYVMPISDNRQTDSFDRVYGSVEEAKNNGNLVPQDEIKKMPLSDHVINPQVLQYTAGEAIAGFCAGFDAHWMVDIPEVGRVKRQVEEDTSPTYICNYFLIYHYNDNNELYRITVVLYDCREV